MEPSEWANKAEVIVLGAGVIGLSTALRIQEQGKYKVTIVAETLPSDPKTARYTSHWAGAHHITLAGDDSRQQRMDNETFDMMWKLSEPGGAFERCFLRIPQTESYMEQWAGRHELEHLPDFRWLEKGELPEGAVCGVKFTTLTIDTPVFLSWLSSRFLAAGGTLIRGSVQHISQLAEAGARLFIPSSKMSKPPAAIVVCPGLAARFLGGVEDKDMYPIRGQTLLLRAPWVREGHTLTAENGVRVYTIPRRGGDLIIGGTKDADDWYPHPRSETSRAILTRVLELAPEVVPPHLRANPDGPPQVEDALPLVIEEGCGFRPARRGGVRLGVDWIAAGPKADRRIPIVYNYGHAGYGFQSSWGSAGIALELLEGALKGGEAARDELNKMAAPGTPSHDVLARSW